MGIQNTPGIYCIENMLDHKKYVGASKRMGNRFARHRHKLTRGIHPNHHLQHAWNRDGESAFRFYPLLFCNVQDLPSSEVAMIADLRSNDNAFGYNLDGGGQQSHRLAEETKQKIRAKMLGHAVSKEAREKIRQAHLGHRNHNFGKPMSAEARAKSAAKHRGKACAWHHRSVATRIANGNYKKATPAQPLVTVPAMASDSPSAADAA